MCRNSDRPAAEWCEAPEEGSGLRVIRVEKPADPALAAGHADDQLVLHDERRTGRGVAAGRHVIEHLRLPQLAAGFRIDGDDVHVERVHEQRRAENGETAVDPAAAVERAFGIAMLVHPKLPAGERVQRVNRVLGSRQIHDAVHDERRGSRTSRCAVPGTATSRADFWRSGR
jgi:hypothetical protein